MGDKNAQTADVITNSIPEVSRIRIISLAWPCAMIKLDIEMMNGVDQFSVTLNIFESRKFMFWNI